MKKFKGPKTQNEVQNDDKLIWESFISREDSEDTGRIPHDVDSFGTSTDQSNDFMNDQELLNPLHKAAQATGADDIVDYMIKQIKAQGDNWIEWFIDTVIGDEEDYDESTDVQEADTDKDVKDLQALHDNPDEEFAKKNYGSVQAYKDMLKKKIDKLLNASNCT